MIYHNLSILHIILFFSILITFFLKYFFYSEFFLISLLQFFFIKCSNNIFTIEIINNIRPRNCILNFTNNKNLFRRVQCVSFTENIFVFRNSYMITSFKFSTFIINFFLKINICIILYKYTHPLYHLIYRYIHFSTPKSCIYKFWSLMF